MPEAKNTTSKQFYSKENFLKRRIARLMAVQSLYSTMLTPEKEANIDKAIYDIIKLYENNKITGDYTQRDEPYLINIARGAYQNKERIDELIQQYLDEKWKVSRLGKVILSILRAAIYELQKAINLDAAIIINEYLEITKYLNHSGEVGFINSVLDKIAKK